MKFDTNCSAAIEKSLSYKLEDARNAVKVRIIKAIREYRNLFPVQHRSSGRMIYPESLKFLPLYGLALCKSIPLRGGFADAQLDERCAAGFTMMALPVKKLLNLLYPNLVRVDESLVKVSISQFPFSSSMGRVWVLRQILPIPRCLLKLMCWRKRGCHLLQRA